MKKLLLGAACLFAVSMLSAATLLKDPAVYDIAGYKLENVWIQSRTAGGFPTSGGYSATDASRGMAVKDGKILITKRIPGALPTDRIVCQVLVYSGATGDLLNTVVLPDTLFNMVGLDGVKTQTGLPANDIQVDGAGNILVANYTSNIYTSPYIIYKIDIDFTAGIVTNAKRVLFHQEPYTGATPPTTMRLDYFGVYGDVMNNGYLMSSVGGTVAGVGNQVLRWDIFSGVTAGYFEIVKILEYVPAAATGNDTGSRVTPLDENLFYLDGQSSVATLYDMNGNYVDGFKSIIGTDLIAKNMTAGNNGVDEFKLGSKSFMIHSYRNTTGTPPSSWAIAEIDPTGATPIKPLVAFPAAGMGTTSNGVRTALPRIEVVGDVANLYVYGCNNGLAAYKFSVVTGPNAVDLNKMSNVNVTLVGNQIRISEEVALVQVFSVTGQKVATQSNVSTIAAPVAKGVYIVTIVDKNGKKLVQKVAVN